VSEGRFALVWNGCDRREATEFARQVVRGVREWGQQRLEGRAVSFSLSVGLATVTQPTRNFPARELVTAAERCLSGAQTSGGDCVKSIEL
jgi:PleD family two-component response regulator